MPLLSPTSLEPQKIRSLIREASTQKNKKELETILENNGLGTEDVIEAVGSMMRMGETEGVRIKAAEIGLKLNGLLQSDQTPTIPIVNIIIHDSNEHLGINPILIPRQ